MASPAFQTKTDLTGGFKNTSTTIAVPASVAADDIIVIAIYRESTDTPTITGFTLKTTASPTSHKLHILWKRATGADSGTYTIGLSVDNVWTAAAALRVSGCITSGDPWDTGTGAPSTAVNNSSSTTAPTVSLTTTVADTLLVYAGTSFAGGAWTAPSGMTERTDTSDDLTTDTLAQASAAATGSKAAACAGSGAMSSFLGALMSPSTGTSANAENAAGTGTSNAASIAIGVNAENAAGTGTANNATVSTATATSANAENAAATGTAYDATVSTVPSTSAPAGLASGTGTANTASIAIGPSAGVASATGTAYDLPRFEFPETILGIHVYVAPGADAADDPDDWPWVDITDRAMSRGAIAPIRIQRGAMSENAQAPVATASLQLNNRDGAFSTQNYNSPYWPDLRRGTPVRITIEDGPIQSVRFTGKLDELPPRWDTTGVDRWVAVTASGPGRRLNVGVKPSEPTSGVTVPPAVTSASRAAADCVASWPCTDTSGDSADEVVADDAELSRNDSSKLVWSQVTGPDGMTLLPSFVAGGVLSGAVPSYTTSSEWTVEVAAQIDDRSSTTTLVPLVVTTSGTASEYSVQLGSDGTISVLWLNAGGSTATACSVVWPLRDGAWHTWSLRAAQSGGNIGVDLQVDGTSITTGTITSQTTGDLRYLRLGDGQADAGIVSMGYARTFRSSTPVDAVTITEAVAGYTTETADVRFERLCVGAGVPVEIFGTSAQLMGPQSNNNLMSQLRECETVDAGLMAESREGRVALYCRALKENAVSQLTLDMSAGEVAPPFEPDDSDATTVNSQTVTLASDSAVTATITDPDHIELYELYEGGNLSINAAAHSQVPPAAGLRVWLGTYTGLRYPKVKIALHRNPELAATCVDLDFHQRITLTNPSEPPGDDIDLLLIGCVEELGQYHWMQTWTTAPYDRWEIPLVAATPATGDGTGWLLPDTFVFAEDVDLTETAIDVTSVPVLPTAAAHYPVRIRHGAEQMTATACSGAGPTQTLTVTRATAGIATTHANGDDIEIVDALVLTL